MQTFSKIWTFFNLRTKFENMKKIQISKAGTFFEFATNVLCAQNLKMRTLLKIVWEYVYFLALWTNFESGFQTFSKH